VPSARSSYSNNGVAPIEPLRVVDHDAVVMSIGRSPVAEVTMAYAIANFRGRSAQHTRVRKSDDALDSARGIVVWTLISALVFWVPLGIVLVR